MRLAREFVLEQHTCIITLYVATGVSPLISDCVTMSELLKFIINLQTCEIYRVGRGDRFALDKKLDDVRSSAPPTYMNDFRIRFFGIEKFRASR